MRDGEQRLRAAACDDSASLVDRDRGLRQLHTSYDEAAGSVSVRNELRATRRDLSIRDAPDAPDGVVGNEERAIDCFGHRNWAPPRVALQRHESRHATAQTFEVG